MTNDNRELTAVPFEIPAELIGYYEAPRPFGIVEVEAVLVADVPKVVAAELDRLIRDPANFTPGGEFRVIVLVKRITELKAGA